MSDMSETIGLLDEEERPLSNHAKLGMDDKHLGVTILELEQDLRWLHFEREQHQPKTANVHPAQMEIEHLRARGYVLGFLEATGTKKALLIAANAATGDVMVYNRAQHHFETTNRNQAHYLHARLSSYLSGRRDLFARII